jgi:aspartokinase
VTSGLLALHLQALGCKARSWLGWQLPVRTDDAHAAARIEDIDSEALLASMARGEIAVIPGFQGLDPDGRVTTLGRGGSDTSAVAVAAAVGADRCDIYTDVDGVYTTDPRIVAKARKLKYVTYEEMLELASVGSKVLQTRSVSLAMKEGVRVQVLSSFIDESAPPADSIPGTMIVSDDELEGTEMERQLITGIAADKNEAKVTLTRVADRPGAVAAIFGPLAEANINVGQGRDRRDFHLPAGGPRPHAGAARRAQGHDRLLPHDRGQQGRQGLGRGCGHAQPCRCRRDDVQGAGRARHQYPGDLDQRDQGLGADRFGRGGACRARAAHRL